MEISPKDTSLKDFYKLLTGTVVPRPIAWVSTVNQAGQPNLAPFSFFNAVCSKPPTVLFCPGIRGTDGGIKDTLKNIRANGEFVINLVTEELVEAMNMTATELPSEINEFERAYLTPAASQVVKPPRVAESPVNFECRVSQIVDIGDGGKGSASIVIGEVLHMQILDQIVDPNLHIDTLALKPVARLGGPNYATIGKILEIRRFPSEIEPK
jgi:flavin reductase (DIM6/NTAB) family NADH-FMN oxidoreductase RutF